MAHRSIDKHSQCQQISCSVTEKEPGISNVLPNITRVLRLFFPVYKQSEQYQYSVGNVIHFKVSDHAL